MPRIPYRYPAAGTDAVADAIRERRGAARGLTPLDGMLLNSSPIAAGWNNLLGAIRTKSSLPDDIREIMILRVAARNRAAYEWSHHEGVARKAGLTNEQLARVGDVSLSITSLSDPSSADNPSAGAGNILSRLQNAALAFAEASTAHVQVPDAVFGELKEALKESIAMQGDAGADKETLLNEKLVEAAATVATYNMVSRFLVATDIDDKANTPCAVPLQSAPNAVTITADGDGTFPKRVPDATLAYASEVRYITVPGRDKTPQIRAVRAHFASLQAPWILLINSLMTNQSMWDWVLPSLKKTYNVITYDQAGHGLSDVPPNPDHDCSIHTLADDAASIVQALGVPKLHAVIGVSQGGATALSFAIRHAALVDKVVACDTQPLTPAANIGAWDERIKLARGASDATEHGDRPAGMGKLADVTVARWFDVQAGNKCLPATREKVKNMVVHTPVEGFVAGARALQSYDLYADGLKAALGCKGASVLLVAGELDGKIPQALSALQAELGGGAHFELIKGAGHLPMCDSPQGFLQAVLPFLEA
ncbi:alpha/beta-hydrolase [Tilletiaria anomala UBC 951]|uniref:Alpha/beta-hydrolase n=1 Tax=Tilletiaria anomala (strain ATCC 24038 / CBS 436.72 / UBC 951) TaxID=1037660 RepID=A0A066V6M8_TILAU|nr:alpha/beta-hydrolase [Tilletiaria anomala UBC 951]KDN35918.1 alpha/beta-hydrolase [Tilletiaria anomala UBC 951]